MNDKPKRRRFRYSLRTLLILVTIACAGFGWLGVKVRQVERQREAVEAIRELFGIVAYDYECDLDNDAITPPGPVWLRKLAGDDFFANVEFVVLSTPGLTNSDLVHVEALPRLKRLFLSNSQITDSELVHLEGLSQLEELRLDGTNVTDTGLIHLRGLRQLKRLIIRDTKVTEAGCQELQKSFPNLEIIR